MRWLSDAMAWLRERLPSTWEQIYLDDAARFGLERAEHMHPAPDPW